MSLSQSPESRECYFSSQKRLFLRLLIQILRPGSLHKLKLTVCPLQAKWTGIKGRRWRFIQCDHIRRGTNEEVHLGVLTQSLDLSREPEMCIAKQPGCGPAHGCLGQSPLKGLEMLRTIRSLLPGGRLSCGGSSLQLSSPSMGLLGKFQFLEVYCFGSLMAKVGITHAS